MSLNIPSFLQAFNNLSPIKWSMGNLGPYTLRGVHFSCEKYQEINGKCPVSSGEEALALYKLEKDPEMYIMALGICTIIYRFLAYLVLKAVKERWVGIAWGKVSGRFRTIPAQPSGETTDAILR